MRLLELELENWGRHAKLKVDLSKGLQIEGRNGTGKSSILEAIRFIFSESGRGYTSRIRNGSNSARVKLRLSKDQDVYSIEKKLYPKKPSTAQMWINRNPAADNASSVYLRLQDVLTEDVIDNLVYVPQGSLTELVNRLRMKGGRQELDRLFGLDKLETVYKGIGEELKIKETQHAMLSSQLAQYGVDAEKVNAQETKTFSEEIKALEKKLSEDRRSQKIAADKIEQLEKKIAGARNSQRKREKIERDIHELRIKIVKADEELISQKKSLDLVKEKKKTLEELTVSSAGLKKYPAIKDLLAALEDTERRLKDLHDLENQKKIFGEVELDLNNKYGLEIEYDAIKSRMMKLGGVVAVHRQQIAEQKTFLKELNSLAGKATCPRCGQVLEKDHSQKEKKASEEKLHTLEKELKESGGEFASEERKTTALEKALNDLRRKEAENKQRSEWIEKASKEKELLTDGTEKMKKALAGAGYCGESLKEVETKLKDLGKMEATITMLLEETGKESHYARKATDLERSLSALKEDERRMQEEFVKLGAGGMSEEELLKRKDEFNEQKNLTSIAIEKTEFQLSEKKGRVKELEARKKEFLVLKEKANGSGKETSLLKEARDIFHTDKGVTKYLREKYIKQLSILLTQHFRRINQNPKYRDIVFDKDYELDIRTTEGNFSVDQLSGGEKVQLAIALRIALIELLSPMRLLMLDEPFGSLDREHRDVLGEALNRIANEGQLIIVTHIPVDSLQLPQLDLGGY